MPVPGLPNPLVSIHLKNVSIHTNHGVSEAEREVGQRMLFSVDLILPECPATETDELEGTIDYGSVTELLVETVRRKVGREQQLPHGREVCLAGGADRVVVCRHGFTSG